MTEDFISKQDRIIAAAIDVISESGISALTTKHLAMKSNISEVLLYKYYENIDSILVDVVEFYFKFDKGIRKTINHKNGSSVEKIRYYIEAYATYYDNYYAISTLMLQYEELLHNIYTRDRVTLGIKERKEFLSNLYREAIQNGEMKDIFTAEELYDISNGIISSLVLNRRHEYSQKSFKDELNGLLDRLFEFLVVK